MKISSMIKKVLFGFATLFVMAGSNLYAEEAGAPTAPKISGYADIWTNLSNSSATKELKTSANAEVDIEKTVGPVAVRLDVDVTTGGAEIEQAKFVKGFGGGHASFTGGIFNAPIGFESQDAPDKLQFSNGQLFDLVPSNLSGVMFSWWSGPASVDLYFANDWNGQPTPQTGFDNSLGGQLKVKAGQFTDISVGYISSDRDPGSPKGNDDLVDLVISTGRIKNAVLAVELLKDEINEGVGFTANYKHGQHGLTFRWDSVENTPAKSEVTSTTLALTCAMDEALTTVLEWKSTDPGGTAKKTDMLTLEWVARF